MEPLFRYNYAPLKFVRPVMLALPSIYHQLICNLCVLVCTCTVHEPEVLANDVQTYSCTEHVRTEHYENSSDYSSLLVLYARVRVRSPGIADLYIMHILLYCTYSTLN